MIPGPEVPQLCSYRYRGFHVHQRIFYRPQASIRLTGGGETLNLSTSSANEFPSGFKSPALIFCKIHLGYLIHAHIKTVCTFTRIQYAHMNSCILIEIFPFQLETRQLTCFQCSIWIRCRISILSDNDLIFILYYTCSAS